MYTKMIAIWDTWGMEDGDGWISILGGDWWGGSALCCRYGVLSLSFWALGGFGYGVCVLRGEAGWCAVGDVGDGYGMVGSVCIIGRDCCGGWALVLGVEAGLVWWEWGLGWVCKSSIVYFDED